MAKSDVEISIKSPCFGSLIIRSDSRVFLAENVVQADFIRLRVPYESDFSIEFSSSFLID